MLENINVIHGLTVVIGGTAIVGLQLIFYSRRLKSVEKVLQEAWKKAFNAECGMKNLSEDVSDLKTITHNQNLLTENIEKDVMQLAQRLSMWQENHNLRADDIVDLRKRLDEIDKRTADLKKAQDYVESGHVFGWDPIASKFAWIKRKEDDGTPGVMHIKTDAFEVASND